MEDYLDKYGIKKSAKEYFLLPQIDRQGQKPLFAGDELTFNFVLSLISEKDIAGQTGIPEEKCFVMVMIKEAECLKIIEEAVSIRDTSVIEGEVVED